MLIRLVAAFALLSMTVTGSIAAQSDVEQRPEYQVLTTVQSPSGTLKVDVTLNGECRTGYQVSRLGRPVLGESQLGFLFTDQPQMLRNFEVVGQRTRDHDESWTTPWGEDRTIRDRYRELIVELA